MEDKLIKVTARILGEEYTIRGRMPQEHIERIASYVDSKMLQISEAYPKLGTSRVAVLVAINMADELFKIREQYDHLTQLLEEEWSQRHHPAAREASAGKDPESPSGARRSLGPSGSAAAPGPSGSAAAPGPSGSAAPGPSRSASAPGPSGPGGLAEDRPLFTGDALRPVIPSPGGAPEPDDERLGALERPGGRPGALHEGYAETGDDEDQ